MNEIELSNVLNEYYKNTINNNACTSYVYYEDYKDLEQCNFSHLQDLCKQKGFYIYKTNESPIFTEQCKKLWKKDKGIIIYSDYSLTLTTQYNNTNLTKTSKN